MELNFEERVTELEGLLQQRQTELSALIEEEHQLEREVRAESKKKAHLRTELNGLVCERARLNLETSQGLEVLSEAREGLRSALKHLEVEDTHQYKQQCNYLDISSLVNREEVRAAASNAVIFGSLRTKQERKRKKEAALREIKDGLASAKQRSQTENETAIKTKRCTDNTIPLTPTR